MTVDVLEGIVDGLVRPNRSGGLSGIRIPEMVDGRAAYLAIDSDARLHFVVEFPADRPAIREGVTQGLRVTTEELQIGSRERRAYVDFECRESSLRRTFLYFIDDVVSTLRTSSRPTDQLVRSALDRWRSFWRVQSSGLSHEEAIGLFGELWFLRRWAEGPLEDAVYHWSGPAADRHDFQWSHLSVEVKTCLGGIAAPIHRISSISQLDDPQSGQLCLFSLHVVQDKLASNSLRSLAESIEGDLSGNHDAQHQFLTQLAAVGYTPADVSQYEQTLRVVGERLYRVSSGFPRIVPSSFDGGVPNGVEQVAYSIDMAACQAWMIADRPGLADVDLGA